MSYLYGLTKAYDINKARERSRYFADQSELDLYNANEELKKSIEEWSGIGESFGSVDIIISPFRTEQGAYVTATDLAEMYRDSQYKVTVDEIFNSSDCKVAGYRVTVRWEK